MVRSPARIRLGSLVAAALVFHTSSAQAQVPMYNISLAGLYGAPYTGSAGYQFSVYTGLSSDNGIVAGYSLRITGVSTSNGENTWVYNPTTNTTTLTGLTSAPYTGSAGYQFSLTNLQNAAGQVAGYSQRITGVSTTNGQDAWYYNPTTNLTTAITAGVSGNMRTSDGFGFSSATVLTENGFALGRYSFFAGGLNPSVDRAFLYRPDVGFYELASLVNGGLPANGWAGLTSVEASLFIDEIVGYGLQTGQPTGSQSVYVLVPVPEPGTILGLSSLALGAVGAWRKRRRCVAGESRVDSV